MQSRRASLANRAGLVSVHRRITLRVMVPISPTVCFRARTQLKIQIGALTTVAHQSATAIQVTLVPHVKPTSTSVRPTPAKTAARVTTASIPGRVHVLLDSAEPTVAPTSTNAFQRHAKTEAPATTALIPSHVPAHQGSAAPFATRT